MQTETVQKEAQKEKKGRQATELEEGFQTVEHGEMEDGEWIDGPQVKEGWTFVGELTDVFLVPDRDAPSGVRGAYKFRERGSKALKLLGDRHALAKLRAVSFGSMVKLTCVGEKDVGAPSKMRVFRIDVRPCPGTTTAGEGFKRAWEARKGSVDDLPF